MRSNSHPANRIRQGGEAGGEPCSIPGCGRPSMLSQGNGLSRYLCRYHAQRKSRNGSPWHGTYRASELQPYLDAASRWLAAQHPGNAVGIAVREIDYLLAGSGRVEPAMNLRGLSAATRARIAFARLSEAEVPASRLVAIYVAVAALIEDDFGSHRTREFQIVQAAKVAHRLASGTHRRWLMWNPRGAEVPIELHAYPRSAGQVLRKIGEAIGKVVDPIIATAVPEIIQLKVAKSGPHPSHQGQQK